MTSNIYDIPNTCELIYGTPYMVVVIMVSTLGIVYIVYIPESVKCQMKNMKY